MFGISHVNCELFRHLSFRWNIYHVRHDVIFIVAEDVRETKVLPLEEPKGKNREQEEK